MTRRPLTVVSAAAILLALACHPAGAGVAVGEPAPAFTLQSADGETYSLADLKGKTVVLEWINPNCPFSERHADERTMVETAAAHSEVIWLAINSTREGHDNYLDPAEHLAYSKSKGIAYPVLYDSPGTVGHAYDARTTPHMFVIDGSGKLVYNGAIDDDPRGGRAKAKRTNYVAAALAAQAAGEAPNPATTKPYGCSVKY